VDNFEEQLFSEDIKRKLWYRALALTKNEEDAKDLLQDTFLRAIEKKDKFDGKHMDRWLYRMMRNIFYDNVRKKSYTMKDGDKSIKQKKEFTALNEMPEKSAHGEQELIDTQKDFENCLQGLSEIDRELMSMTLTHSNEDICDVLELSNVNLRVKIHRARSQLADCMGVHH